MKNKISITTSATLDSVEYDIVSEFDGVESTIARCWDYDLAQHLKTAVEEYMEKNRQH